jgi:nicotinate-nucleotide--dimethylbenzimidazole phosphoribosyltransferase
MLLNYASGGAVVCVLARQARITVKAVDVGVKTDLPDASGYISKRVRCGTDDWSEKQAMSEEDALAAIMVGADIVHSEAQNGVKLLGFGEMGIGNTATSSALLCALTGVSPADATGKGTGLDDAGLARKTDVIRMGLSLHAEVIKKGDPISILSALGGLEIAAMAGAYIACAAYRIPVIVDGFICSVSALLASRISPFVKPFLIASHKSVEIGHRVALSELGLTPYLDCEMRLGEGSGAALMIPIVRSALAVLKETATFDEAGVADRG